MSQPERIDSSAAMQLDPATVWGAIEAAAVLGTLQGLPPRLGGSASRQFSAQLEQLDPESRLLAISALEWAWDAAGAEADKAPAPSLPLAPEEDVPPASPHAAEHLRALLSERLAGTLSEWIDAAARGGLRAPDLALPALLEFAGAHRKWRPQIGRVLGHRGRWLAAQRPEWSFAIGVTDEAAFAESPHESRVAFIAELRAQDAARARELVEAAWKEEPADRRAALLGALATGLTMADEPFLEGCLSDRKKEVRLRASDLLSRLAGSRLCRRMADRATPFLVFKMSTFLGLGRARIEVRLPEACDASMAKDGVEPKPPHARIGERAWWLLQMLGAVPLGHWQETWRARPQHIVEALAGNEFEEAMFEGWLLAAERQRDLDWVRVLLLHWPPRRPDLLSRALEALPEQEREQEAHRRLQENLDSGALIHPLRALLPSMELGWSAPLGRTVLGFLRRYATQEDKLEPGALVAFFELTSRRLPPELIPEAGEGWPLVEHLSSSMRRALEELFHWIDFRAQMLKELNRAECPATGR